MSAGRGAWQGCPGGVGTRSETSAQGPPVGTGAGAALGRGGVGSALLTAGGWGGAFISKGRWAGATPREHRQWWVVVTKGWRRAR